MISATVEPPWLDSRLVRTFVEDVLGRAGRDRGEVVQQRLRGRRADHAQHRDQREQHREQREHAEVGQRRGPGRELVLPELLEGPLQDRREGFLGEIGRLVGDVALLRAPGGCGLGHTAAATQNRMGPGDLARKFPDRSALWQRHAPLPADRPRRAPSRPARPPPRRPPPSSATPAPCAPPSPPRRPSEPITANRGAAACAAPGRRRRVSLDAAGATGGAVFARTT